MQFSPHETLLIGEMLQSSACSQHTGEQRAPILLQALRATMPQPFRQGLLPLAENDSSPAASSRGSPELGASREGLPTHWLQGTLTASHRSPARSLAISVPDEAAAYKEGAYQPACILPGMKQRTLCCYSLMTSMAGLWQQSEEHWSILVVHACRCCHMSWRIDGPGARARGLESAKGYTLVQEMVTSQHMEAIRSDA